MTRVAILPIPTQYGEPSFWAIAGSKQAEGRTAGEALDNLTKQLSSVEASTLVVVQIHRSDKFFTDAQQRRLVELVDRWKHARDRDSTLSPTDLAETEALVEAELRASASRAAALVEALKE